MRILFVLGLEVNPKIGGVERVTHVLSDYFMKEGIKVYFLYTRLKNISFPEYNEGVEAFFLPDLIISNSQENVLCLKKIVAENGIDIVINQSNTTESVADLIAQSVQNTKTKIVSVLHASPFTFKQFYGQYKQTQNGYLKTQKTSVKQSIKKVLRRVFALKEYTQSYKKYFKISVQSSDRFVVLSKGYIPVLCGILNIKPHNNIIAIPNPNSFVYKFPEDQLEKKIKQVIYVGRLDYYFKRIDRLLNAWSLIEADFPGWQLVIVGGSVNGSGTDKNDYQVKELERLKLISSNLSLKNVVFAGNTDPVPYYQESALIGLTSTKEGFPMVLIEAMQYGVVPVVFGSFASVYDLIDHQKNGMIAEPFNLAAYASLMSELMGDEDRRKKMAVEAIRTSANYTIEVIGSQWVKIFKEITEGN